MIQGTDMLQPKELRIGIKLLFTDSPHQGIRTIDGNDIAYAEKHPDWLHAFFQGVPVTEEWLLKFGFEIKQEGWYLFAIKGFLKFDISSISEEVVILINDKRISIKYIHQLQNLYFALTQTELTLK